MIEAPTQPHLVQYQWEEQSNVILKTQLVTSSSEGLWKTFDPVTVELNESSAMVRVTRASDANSIWFLLRMAMKDELETQTI